MWHTLETPLVLPSSFMLMLHFHVVEFNWPLCLMSQQCLRIPETDLVRHLIISPHHIQLSQNRTFVDLMHPTMEKHESGCGCIPHADKNLIQYASSKCQVSNELKPWNPGPTKVSKPKILCIRLKSRYHVSKKIFALEIFEMTNLLNSYGSEVLLEPSEIFFESNSPKYLEFF